MDANSSVELINQAIANKNYILLAVSILALVVPIVLHILGKDVPIASAILNGIVDFVKRMKIVAPVPKELPKDQQGLASVVKIEDAPKKDEPK